MPYLDKEKRNQANRKWYQEHKEYYRQWGINYRNKQRPLWRKKHRDSALKRNHKMRDETRTLLGNICANPNCPIPKEKMDKRALQIDHIYGNGAQERKKAKSLYTYYLDILKSVRNKENKYQLLCVYCNWVKRFDSHEEGPHLRRELS